MDAVGCSDGQLTCTYMYMDMYTLGPPLRIPDIKNMGRDLAPEELRICPWEADEILDFPVQQHQNP